MRAKPIFIGRVKENIKWSQCYHPEKDRLIVLGERLKLDKHSWDCGWYWGFGYIGNYNLHCHAKVFIHELLWHSPKEVFETSIFKTDKDFWIFKDLLKQAYALQSCSEAYRIGGHCTTEKGLTDIIQSKEMERRVNQDLKRILDKLWSFVQELNENWEKVE